LHDVHDDSTSRAQADLVLGFAGPREDVEWQIAQAKSLGITESANLNYEEQFWNINHEVKIHRLSVLPSRLIRTLQDVGAASFVARAGNGVVCYRGNPPLAETGAPLSLRQRLKDAFDPKHVFPELSL
jgi:hypothetical protein